MFLDIFRYFRYFFIFLVQLEGDVDAEEVVVVFVLQDQVGVSVELEKH